MFNQSYKNTCPSAKNKLDNVILHFRPGVINTAIHCSSGGVIEGKPEKMPEVSISLIQIILHLDYNVIIMIK